MADGDLHAMPERPDRRARNRRELTASIAEAARRRLREQGTDALTVRGIAGDLGLSPGALYRYVDGRDAILTELITSSYRALAAALADALPETGDPIERLRTVLRRYRTWAIAHPHEFELVFGAPIEGYRAPLAGPTTEAMGEMSTAMLRPAVEAWREGRLVPPDGFDLDAEGNRTLVGTIRDSSGAADLPESFGVWAMALWGQAHGLVALELNGQFHWLYGEDAGVQYDVAIDAMIAAATR